MSDPCVLLSTRFSIWEGSQPRNWEELMVGWWFCFTGSGQGMVASKAPHLCCVIPYSSWVIGMLSAPHLLRPKVEMASGCHRSHKTLFFHIPFNAVLISVISLYFLPPQWLIVFGPSTSCQGSGWYMWALYIADSVRTSGSQGSSHSSLVAELRLCLSPQWKIGKQEKSKWLERAMASGVMGCTYVFYFS